MTPRVRAAVLPHPPLLAAPLTGRPASDGELPAGRAAARAGARAVEGGAAVRAVRSAARDAVRSLLAEARVTGAADHGTVVCVGGGSRTVQHPPAAWGTLAGFGAAVDAPRAHEDAPPTLPLSLTVARLLLEDCDAAPARLVLQEVDVAAPPSTCAHLGAELAAAHPEAAWLVLGDASTTRTERAPGALDPRSEAFDRSVADALARGDAPALAALDPALAAALGASGRAAWQVLAGAAVATGAQVRGELLHDAAPFGVGYLVARWRS